MFNCYEFTFDGESSAMYGLMVYDIGGRGQSDVSFGNKASIVETRTNNRIQPIYFGTNYHSKPLEFKLVFGAERELDRYELEDIAYWLTGRKEYKWLSIGQQDMEQLQFRCMVTELTPISHGWLPVAFQATIQCDCPYAYSYPFESSTRFPMKLPFCSATKARCVNISSLRFRSHLHPAQALCLL